MFTLKKEPEVKFYNREIDEALSFLNKREVNEIACSMGDLALADDGSLITPSGSYELTEYGMLTLLKTLQVKVPKNYAYKITNDHLIYDVNTLLDADERAAICVVKDNNLCGIYDAEFNPVKHEQLITTLMVEEFNIEHMHIAPHMMRLAITGQNEYDVDDDDITKVSLELINSEIGWNTLTSSVMLYRCVCSNCAIIKERSFIKKYKQKNIDQETIMNTFIDANRDRTWEVNGFDAALDYMRHTPNKKLDLIPKKTTIRHNNDDDVDYSGVKGVVHLLKSCVGKEDALEILEHCDDDTKQYETYNIITKAAHRYDTSTARRMEVVGGTMFTNALIGCKAA